MLILGVVLPVLMANCGQIKKCAILQVLSVRALQLSSQRTKQTREV